MGQRAQPAAHRADAEVFACPAAADLEPGKTTYVLPISPGTVWGGQQPLSLCEITDGTSQTAMVVEAAAEQAVVSTQPADLAVTPTVPAVGWGTWHGNAYPVLYCDGSVRFVEGERAGRAAVATAESEDGK